MKDKKTPQDIYEAIITRNGKDAMILDIIGENPPLPISRRGGLEIHHTIRIKAGSIYGSSINSDTWNSYD